jgi:L-cysteine desulfidase
VAAGIVAGDASKKLEVIASVSSDEIEKIHDFVEKVPISLSPCDNGIIFDIIITVYNGNDYAKVRISQRHTNVVLVEKNGNKSLDIPVPSAGEENENDIREDLNLKDIFDFANIVDMDDVEELIENQISCNTAIAEEGLKGDYGVQVGKNLKASFPDTVENRACFLAAAASDARMNGCEMPVVINSGSGNQGLTVSLPVIEYAKELAVPREMLIRALVFANLIAIHQKVGIGRLSAYCGVVSAATAAIAGIAFLHRDSFSVICDTITNSLCTTSGMICDGAKASCASKISVAIYGGMVAWQMAKNGRVLQPGDGIVGEDAEKTISAVGRLASRGMASTNNEIISIMTGYPPC